MVTRFEIPGLTLHESTAHALTQAGIATPTPVQLRATPEVLAGKDVLIQSATGTGKTLAYLLPLLQRIAADDSQRVVIMAPSPELAVQILRAVETYKPPQVRCAGLIGTGNIDRQKDKLKKHPHIMVGTPGRVLELWLARKIKTAQVRTLVLDEVDKILAPQNAKPLSQICSRPEFTAQLVYASATLGERAHAFADRFMNAERVSTHVVGQPVLDGATIQHFGLDVRSATDKEGLLLELLDSGRLERVLLFVNKLYLVSHLYNVLSERGIKCAGLSSERTKHTREQALTGFKSGQVQVLIATDAAARGLDIADLEWVLHFDLPQEPETYVHRSGRVGRAGKQGNSLAFVTQRDTHTLKRYQSTLGVQLSPLD